MTPLSRWMFPLAIVVCLLTACMSIKFNIYEHLRWGGPQRQYFLELWYGLVFSWQNDPSGLARQKESQIEGYAGSKPTYYTPRLILNDVRADVTLPVTMPNRIGLAGGYVSTGPLGPSTWGASYGLIFIPYWWLTVASGTYIGWHLRGRAKRRRDVQSGLCPNCGYDLRASPDRCPECGTPVR